MEEGWEVGLGDSQTSWFRISGYRWTRTILKPMLVLCSEIWVATVGWCSSSLAIASPMMVKCRSTAAGTTQFSLNSSNEMPRVISAMRRPDCWMSHTISSSTCE